MSDDDITIEQIKAVWTKATPGPWTPDDYATCLRDHVPVASQGAEIAGQRPEGTQEANHAAIALAPTHIAWLLARLKALDAICLEYERALANAIVASEVNALERDKAIERLAFEIEERERDDARAHLERMRRALAACAIGMHLHHPDCEIVRAIDEENLSDD
jgi:hypothetical protein